MEWHVAKLGYRGWIQHSFSEQAVDFNHKDQKQLEKQQIKMQVKVLLDKRGNFNCQWQRIHSAPFENINLKVVILKLEQFNRLK